MAKMTKAQSRRRLNEAWAKITKVMLANMDNLPRTSAQDYTALGKIIDKWEKALK